MTHLTQRVKTFLITVIHISKIVIICFSQMNHISQKVTISSVKWPNIFRVYHLLKWHVRKLRRHKTAKGSRQYKEYFQRVLIWTTAYLVSFKQILMTERQERNELKVINLLLSNPHLRERGSERQRQRTQTTSRTFVRHPSGNIVK